MHHAHGMSVPANSKRDNPRRQEILEATLRLIGDGGVNSVTHRAVAEEANVALASTTYYFDSRSALVEEALELMIARSTEYVRRYTDCPPRISQAELVDRLVGFADAHINDPLAFLLAQYELMLEAGRADYLRPLAARWTIAYMDGFHHLVRSAGLPETATADHRQLRRGGPDQQRDGEERRLPRGRLPAAADGLGRRFRLRACHERAERGAEVAHPKDRSGITRRQLARGAAGAVAGAGVVAGLAACENTTVPVGADAAGATGAAAELVVPKPTGPAGLPLPRTDNSVTWAITDDNKPVKDGVKPEAGPLRIYNYPDYFDPATLKKFEKQFSTKVEVATYNSADEAVAKLSSGAVDFDLIVGLTGANIVDLIAHRLLAPLNHSYLPNLEKNIWPELVDPFYDRGSRYTVPYVVWMDGIGWRNDQVKEDMAAMDVPWDIFWQSEPYRGKVGILDDRRDALSMPMQRDAMHAGTRPDLNTEDEGHGRQGPERPLRAERDLQRQGRDHRLPDAARGQDRAAPVVVGRPAGGGLLLHAEGRSAHGALVLGSRRERRRPERLPLHGAHHGAPRAGARVHQLHAQREERLQQLRELQRLRAAPEGHRRRCADQAGA